MDKDRRKALQRFAKALGVTFGDWDLLNQALTHTSYAKERGAAHNERLEYLGDAVLELAASTFIFNHFPKMTEGMMTRTRAAVVCSATLSTIAERNGFGDMLLLSHGEEKSGGRSRISILEDAFEAVVGAIYVDKGWATACDFVWRQLADEFAQVGNEGILFDYKSSLQELVQQQPGGIVEYEMLSSTGPDHAKTFEMTVLVNGKPIANGKGGSKKIAEQQAAQIALKKLQKQ